MGDIAIKGNKLTAAKGGRARLWHGGSHNTGRTNLLEQLGRVEGERSNPNRRAEISRVHGELNRGYKDGGRIGKAHGMSAGKQAIRRITERLGGGEEGKPHSTRTGRIAAGTRKLKRLFGKPKRQRPSWKPHGGVGGPMVKAEGGRIGFRTGTKPSAGQRIKARKAREEEWWTGKRGKHQAMYVPGLDKELREKRPHSSPEGRWGDVKTALAKKRTDRIQADVAKYKRTVPSGRALHKEGGRIGLKKGGNGKWMQKVSASIKKRGTKGKCTPITKPGCTGRAKALAKTFKKIAARRKG